MRRLWSSAHASRSRRSKAMPCDPIGMTVTQGRTSRLKRFLSMPRYAGASRSRRNRGTPAPTFPASIQLCASHDAVCKALRLTTDMCAFSSAGRRSSSRGAPSAAIERQAHLTAAQVDPRRAASCSAAHPVGGVRHPGEHIAAQPANPPAMQPTPSGKSAEQYHPEEYPSGAAGEACDVVGA